MVSNSGSLSYAMRTGLKVENVACTKLSKKKNLESFAIGDDILKTFCENSLSPNHDLLYTHGLRHTSALKMHH